MSDSDWEVLSSDGDGQPTPQQQQQPSIFNKSADPTTTDGVRASFPSNLPLSIDRRSILTPLCLTLNQTGTRLGVGHTRGFLVFRVNPATTTTQQHDSAATQAVPAPPRSHLVLDPQYNIDLFTFSRVRERLRRQQARRMQQTTSLSADEPAALFPHKDEAHRDTENAKKTGGNGVDEHARDGRRGGGAIERDEPLSPELDLDDLGSFLTAAGRAFAQLRRDDAHGEVHASPSHRKRESRMKSSEALDVAPEEKVAAEKEDEKEETSTLDSAVAAPADGAAPIADDTAADAAAAVPTLVLSSCTRRGPDTVLEWGDEEDIDVDGTGEGSLHDVPLSSVGDSAAAPRRLRQQNPQRRHARGSATSSETHTDTDSDEEGDESYVGFTGGGVAVMSLLYDQPWLALVGGGATPMGPPNQVQMVRDGEVQHRLTLPNPVVRLFLDARLLFVVTTAELRVYSNPLEHNWVCLRQTIAMSAIVAARYASVTLAPAASGNADMGGVARVWGTARASDDAQHSAQADASATEPPPPPALSNASTTVALPSIPVVVDYARSLLLLPTGDAGTGFALYRYVSGPEPVARALGEGPATAFTAAGRTTAYLELVATQPVAHQNPLHNLVLYVGWPAASARLLPTEESPSRNSIDESPSASPPAPPHARVSSRSSSGRDGGRSGGGAGGSVTLVAASSEYATRITLWMLLPDDDTLPRQQQRQPTTPGSTHRDPLLQSVSSASSASITTAAEGRFALLREFRVGLRLRPPRVVMAALPGVTRLMHRAPASSTSTTAATTTTAGNTPHPSAASLAQESRGGNGSGGMSVRDAGSCGPTAESRGHGFALPVDAASSSAMSSYRGTVASWATEAASAVAAAGAGATASVHHLQFIGNGAYLLCVHGTDVVSVFSTSAPESEQEAKDVTRDRAAAAQNRYSRLAVMKEYLPKTLSSRLDAYTRQAWSSCGGRLPSYDAGFVPRWLYLKQQDAAAAAAAGAARGARSRSPTGKRGMPAQATSAAAALSSPAALPSSGGSGDAPVAGRRFFQRLSALVGARPQSAVPPPLQQQPTPEPRSSSLARQHVQEDSSLVQRAPTATTTRSPEGTQVKNKDAAVVRWGSPLTELSRCVIIWSASVHAPHGVDVCGGAGASRAASRCPLVLNCATCEGTFANILLFAEEGEVVSSSVVPYTTE